MDLSKKIIALAFGIAFSLSGVLLADGFSFLGTSNRFITPNGDGKNDNIAFNFYNPAYSEVQGYIYDLKGRLVANTMPPNTTDINGQLLWNGKSNNGTTVNTGVYVYLITCESSVYRGVVVVIR
jgi:gliding motility-associated-like protein